MQKIIVRGPAGDDTQDPTTITSLPQTQVDATEQESDIVVDPTSDSNVRIINPGESKEVTLTLTKKMTEDNLGLYHNEAEIYEAYNDLGITDVDSTPANRTSSEDDISTADVVITVKTGETILVIALSTTIILMISIGAYFIKKKVLR